jgi:enoyl-CoA hydratase
MSDKPTGGPAAAKYEAIRYEQADGVATITLNRPDVHNAMNQAMRRELLEVFTHLRTDDSVRAVVVVGGGDKAFSAGADIREFLEPPVPTQFREARRRVDFRREMERCPQAIIAAIRGYAFGGGLELALACDIRVAAEDAQLGLTEINLAIIPGGGGTQRLTRALGTARALELMLEGTLLAPTEAREAGLVHRVIPAERLVAEAQATGERLARRTRLCHRLSDPYAGSRGHVVRGVCPSARLS